MGADLSKLAEPDDLLERLIARFDGHPHAVEFFYELTKARLGLQADLRAQQRRFDRYLPERPADEPHDAGCQITRLGGIHSCTCASNMVRRRQQVQNAAEANDQAFRETIGSMEQYAFDQHRKGKRQ